MVWRTRKQGSPSQVGTKFPVKGNSEVHQKRPVKVFSVQNTKSKDIYVRDLKNLWLGNTDKDTESLYWETREDEENPEFPKDVSKFSFDTRGEADELGRKIADDLDAWRQKSGGEYDPVSHDIIFEDGRYKIVIETAWA